MALMLLLAAVYISSRPVPAAPSNTPTLVLAELTPEASGFAAGVVAAETPPGSATLGPTATRRPTRTPRTTATPNDGLPTIAFDDLPRQAQETIRLIDQGGPFPYRQDGAVFQNRERLLPRQPSGYYREYTVVTPGESDRGARRIIAGAGGELYYTADHYASFRRVVR